MWFRPRPHFIHVLHSSAHLKGPLRFQGPLLLEGTVHGDLIGEGSKSLVVVRGLVQGNIEVHEVHVEGTVEGNIKAHTLVVRPKGKLTGAVEAQRVHFEDGSIVDAQHVHVCTRTTPQSPTSAEGSAQMARSRLMDGKRGDNAGAQA